MTREALKVLSDDELREVGVWALEEARERADRRKQDTIARIKALAVEAGIHLTIETERKRGRPKKGKVDKQERQI
jgi:nucleotide-binding universal stress UspA family protein